MLSLTRKTDYALVALSYLATRRSDGAKPVSARQISQAFGLPLALLMNILKELVQARMLNSTRGSSGGYELAAEPGRITLLEVVTAMQGPVRLTLCADGLPVVGQGCTLSEGCPIRGPIRALHGRLNRFLEELTLEDLQGNGSEGLPEPGEPGRQSGTRGTDGWKSEAADCGCRTTQNTKPATEPTKAEIYQGA